MVLVKTIDEIRNYVREKRRNGSLIGFVPTMGALHEGHIKLIGIALDMCDTIVVSIFVNPEQFGPNEDFDTYPRDIEKDLEICRDLGVDVIFAPERDTMYDDQKYFSIGIHDLNRYMCGASRPGFFEGVVLVVNKLFNIVEPDIAVFGQKDIQQFLILKQMVHEFNHNTELVMGPVVRADDGLALSSRNAYLSDEERKIAPGLYRSLRFIKKQVLNGVNEPKLLISHQKSELEAKGFKIDYLSIYSKQTLEPVKTLSESKEYIVAGAVYLGNTRLIDNIIFQY